ncbi:hypothetical protein GT037_002016 [Alternaria burnsii]|uniref:Uncharacterized protein n=1 Tax=Alternaria burnsii TaxID=1187904 RepID=A0A8H7BE15_9PLEO|nr:uncharacterized protein GT037_002016 [Alternaria burnsii]KAF7680365.1 hypothetical protein GT037_002016 [Alternaria burnsii]CAI9628572.1 unnamed protein product [Alternaria burnsii]
MDAASSELIHFVVVPVETVVACIYVLDNIVESLPTDVLDTHQDHQDAQCLQTLIANGRSLISDIEPWPLVVKESSLKHRTVSELHEVASSWLERSPLFRSDLDELGEYLELLPGFSTNGIKVKENGTMGNPWIVLLEQDERRRWYDSSCHQMELLKNSEGNKLQYRRFLTQFMWMRENAPKRMFAKEFSGKYQERTLDTERRDVLRQDKSLSAVTESSTVIMNTPSTSRSISPDLTEHSDNITSNMTEQQAVLPPTLKYIAIIETNTNKAFFNFDPSDINEKKREILNSAKDMCTQMVSKGYGGKVKLQDIMDIVVDMAK